MIDRVSGSSNTNEEKAAEREGDASVNILRSIRVRWAANVGYAILLVIMALIPTTSRVTELSVPDWFAHAVAYGIQAALIFWALLPSISRHRALLMGVVGASVFGMVTEGLQLLQPVRSVEFKDLVANTAGALLVCGIIAGLGRYSAGIER